MLYSLWNDFTSSYKALVGTGSILVLFVVAVFYLYMSHNRSTADDSNDGRTVYPLFLSVWGTIGVAFSAVISIIIGNKINADEGKSAYVRNMFVKICMCIVLVFAVVISGSRIIAPQYYEKSQNRLHIPEDVAEVIAVLQSDKPDGIIGVATMPGYGVYYSSFDSRFTMLYEDAPNGDSSKLKAEIRQAYQELNVQYPDMRIVADAARMNGCEYIVIRNDAYWPKEPLDNFGYDLMTMCNNWNIYKAAEGVNNK